MAQIPFYVREPKGTKVLIYGNRKCEDLIWDISTPEKEEAAYRALFIMLDTQWLCYSELAHAKKPTLCEPCFKGLHRHCELKDSCICTARFCGGTSVEKRSRWIELYKLAKQGDYEATRKLMTERKDFEYEQFHFNIVKDATETAATASK